MKKLRIFHDTTGNTLTVWFDEPKKESICEEIDGDIVIMKDKQGNAIGFEKLNFISSPKDDVQLPLEIISNVPYVN